ncbi:MAG: presenilin family intramembrane aspartyl protease [Candidatus Staskawiczbacteria bacterium]|nr:presenilin family intramembrane aspartyl protease [Candidatus Staskawiczbacteria bacterium]
MKYTEPKIIKQRKQKKEAVINFWRIFSIQGGLFLLTSILAVFSAFKLNKLVQTKEIYLPATSWQDFLFSFLFVTFFIIVFATYKKAGKFKEIIYKALFIISVFWGGMTILNLFMPVFMAVILMGILIIFWLERPSILVHDILMILGLAGVASFFGLGFSPAVVVALLLIFSVYDFIAVYKTKHMVLMAKEMIEKKVIFGFIIPKEFKFFKDNFKNVKPGRVARASRGAGAPNLGNFMILGGGDVVFPNLLVASVIPFGIYKALVIVLFSLIGCFMSYWIFSNQDKKEPMPALPPIAFFSIVGYLITLFF